MFCKNCGKKSEVNQKFCTSCGAQFSSINEIEKETPKIKSHQTITHTENSWGVGKIIKALIIVAVVGIGIYHSLDEDSITKNNEGLSSFDSGDSQTAINQLQQARQDAVTNDTKMNSALNLAYVYSSETQYEKALQLFKEAFGYANEDSFEYYLISGEIALFEGKPNAAKLSYDKAYQLRPNDFQVNNALNLFYIDIEEIAPFYSDYPKALKHAQKAYEVSNPESKNIAKQNLAIAYYFNENYNQTISLLSVFDFNKEPYLAYWLGLAYLNKEDHINARIYLQKAVNGGVEVPQEIYDYLGFN